MFSDCDLVGDLLCNLYGCLFSLLYLSCKGVTVYISHTPLPYGFAGTSFVLQHSCDYVKYGAGAGATTTYLVAVRVDAPVLPYVVSLAIYRSTHTTVEVRNSRRF